MAVKKSTKSVKEEKPVANKPVMPTVKRFDQGEMRRLEELSHAVTYAQSQRNLYDQYTANLILKKEKLIADIKLLEHEIERAKELQVREEEKIKGSTLKLQNLGNELKSKYGIKSTGFVKYDNTTGEIIDK